MLRLRPLGLDTDRRALDARFVPPGPAPEAGRGGRRLLRVAPGRRPLSRDNGRPGQHPERMGRRLSAEPDRNRSDARVCLAAGEAMALRWSVRLNAAESPPSTARRTSRTERLDEDVDRRLHVAPRGVNDGDDANGNLVSRGTLAFAYDARNRLARVDDGSATVGRYGYDGDGARARRVDATGTVHYVARHFEAALGDGTAPAGATAYYYARLGGPGAAERLIAFRRAGVLRWAGLDHLSGTARTADAAFAPLGQQRYLPFGGSRDGTANLATDRLFTGQTRDDVSGLYWFTSRYYDPNLGRFCQPDTVVQIDAGIRRASRPFTVALTDADALKDLGDWHRRLAERDVAGTAWPSDEAPLDPQLLNRYAYARNNPLRYTDSTGHFVFVAIPAAYFGYAALGVLAAGAVYVWESPANARNREIAANAVSNAISSLTNPPDDQAEIRIPGIGGRIIEVTRTNEHWPPHGHVVDGPDRGLRLRTDTGEIYEKGVPQRERRRHPETEGAREAAGRPEAGGSRSYGPVRRGGRRQRRGRRAAGGGQTMMLRARRKPAPEIADPA